MAHLGAMFDLCFRRCSISERSPAEGLIRVLFAVWPAILSTVASADILPAVGVRSSALGAAHGCAVYKDGRLQCWGDNGDGQLGTGDFVPRAVASNVIGLSIGVTAVAAGDHHTCAILAAGSVKCWGNNSRGQLGTGNTTASSLPVNVLGLSSGSVAIAAGRDHTCVLTSQGAVKCWGDNLNGQLGNFAPGFRLVEVLGLSSGAIGIAVGADHSCAILKSGGMRCWGANSEGQLGDGGTAPSGEPVVVQTISGVVAAAAGGQHTCAVLSTGGTKCWGGNTRGQLGLGFVGVPVHIPMPVSNLPSPVQSIAAGPYHTCATAEGGATYCWGENDQGQLGSGTFERRLTPGLVVRVAESTMVVAGGGEQCAGVGESKECVRTDRSCALSVAGMLSCWGANQFRELGIGSATRILPARDNETFALVPLLVNGLSGAQVSVGANFTCAISIGGGAHCWGKNDHGQLGVGDRVTRTQPVAVNGLGHSVTKISAGGSHTCAIEAGKAFCWGNNGYGQLGNGTLSQRDSPKEVSGVSPVADIGVGDSHSCAVTLAGGVKCWGDNAFGQLGDGTRVARTMPVDVVGLNTGVRSIAIGSSHSCAMLSNGSAKCWGSNRNGTLGNGNNVDQSIPVDVASLGNSVTSIAAAERHTCAISSGGTATCWGNNLYGQLGAGSTSDSLVPLAVLGLPAGILGISVGAEHTCALTLGGRAKCWGWGADGRLGDGTEDQTAEPRMVELLPTGIKAIASGRSSTCALSVGGSLWCWGRNDHGQIGSPTEKSTLPMTVLALTEPGEYLPVTEFVHEAMNHYFRTASEAEASGVDQGAAGAGWRRTGDIFGAFDKPRTGTEGVCRFYGTPGRGPNSHFYTANPAECLAVKQDPGWTFEGIAFHAFPPGPSGGCDPEHVPVMRTYNGRWQENDSNHRYTVNSGTYTLMQNAGWLGEGVVMCVPRS